MSFSFHHIPCVAWVLLISLSALVLAAAPAHAQTIHELSPADTAHTDAFGVTVAVDGRRALVGASGEDVCGANAGAAYVFEQDDAGVWQQTARLVPSTCRAGAFFGRALALSGDRALVGASVEFFAQAETNVAYLFERDTAGVWHEVDQLTVAPEAAEGTFAASVALDGERALLTTQGDPTRQHSRTRRPDGAAYLFERDAATGRWHQAARLHGRPGGHGFFGADGALDGDRAVVAAAPYAKRRPGAVYVFERDADGAWHEAAYLDGIRSYFLTVALGHGRLLVGAAQAGRRGEGRAYVYTRAASGRWRRTATLRPHTPYASGAFGTAVSLDGERALVTGYDEQLGHDFNIDRVVYVFVREGGAWRQAQIIDIGEVDFATAVALSGAVAVIGHAPEGRPGAAYVVRLY